MNENRALVKTKVLSNTLDPQMLVQGPHATRLSCCEAPFRILVLGKAVKNDFTG